MATPLKTPSGISTERKNDQLTITWSKVPEEGDNPVFGFRFVHRDDPHDFITDIVPDKADNTDDKLHTYTITGAARINRLKSYLAQVKQKAAEGDTDKEDSAWGTEVIWIAGPTLTIKIGSTSYTLSKGSGKGSVYKLPVSEDKPLIITYDDLKQFVSNLSLELPDTFPNGEAIKSQLEIYEFAIDTDKKLFSLNISLKIDWELFSGLKVEKMGLSVKRTDGTI